MTTEQRERLGNIEKMGADRLIREFGKLPVDDGVVVREDDGLAIMREIADRPGSSEVSNFYDAISRSSSPQCREYALELRKRVRVGPLNEMSSLQLREMFLSIMEEEGGASAGHDSRSILSELGTRHMNHGNITFLRHVANYGDESLSSIARSVLTERT